MSAPLVKICGLMTEQDIETINRYRPDYAGFIINFPKSHRSKTPAEVERLTANLIPDIVSVGVFVDEDPALIADLLRRGVIDMAQLHGHEDADQIRYIRRESSHKVIKAFVIRGEDDLRMAAESEADEILLDAGMGQGMSFDWSLLSGFGRRYFLAGGLRADNISKAIARTSPYAIDVSSGVETGGHKDPEKIASVIGIVRGQRL